MSSIQAENLFQWLLKEEDCESDDRRFYCSYLIAHSSLSMADDSDDSHFFDTMHSSLEEALQEDKLSDEDKLGINSLWEEACKQSSNPL